MKYICDHVDSRCPVKCPHRTEHDRILDIYNIEHISESHFSYCDEEGSPCGYKFEEPIVKCIPIKTPTKEGG